MLQKAASSKTVEGYLTILLKLEGKKWPKMSHVFVGFCEFTIIVLSIYICRLNKIGNEIFVTSNY